MELTGRPLAVAVRITAAFGGRAVRGRSCAGLSPAPGQVQLELDSLMEQGFHYLFENQTIQYTSQYRKQSYALAAQAIDRACDGFEFPLRKKIHVFSMQLFNNIVFLRFVARLFRRCSWFSICV